MKTRFLKDNSLSNFLRRLHKRRGIYYTTYQILINNEFDFKFNKPKLLSDEVIIKNKGVDVIIEMEDKSKIKGKIGDLSEDGNIMNIHFEKEVLPVPLCHMSKMALLI